MKNKNSIGKYLFNPFQYIAGGRSLIFGLIVLIVLSLLGYLTHTFFDGVLDAHYGCLASPNPYYVHILCILLSWFSITLILCIATRIFSSSSIRLIDMAGTLALAKTPLIFVALYGFVPSVHLCLEGLAIDSMLSLIHHNWVKILFMAMISIIFSIWSVILMYNAFSVSGNLKGTKGIRIFAVGLLISEILSKGLIYLAINVINYQ